MADELSAVAEPIEQTDAAEVTTEEAAQPVEGEERAQEQTEAPAEEVTGDGRTLPAAIKALKATNPEAYEAAKRSFFAERDYASQFPGGLREAKEILGFLAEQGGREGIQQAIGEVQDYRGLTQAMADGNVNAVLDRVNEIAPEFVAKAAPDILNRFKEVAPDECNALLCGVVAKSISTTEIPQNLYGMGMALKYLAMNPNLQGDPSLAVLQEAVANLSKEINAFGQVAAIPAQQRQTSKPDALQQREAELTQREKDQMVGNYRTQMKQFIEPQVRDEAKTLGYDLNERQLSMLYKEVAEAADKAVGNDGTKLIESHLSRKDVSNAVKTAQSRYGQVLKDVIKREAGELFRMPTKPKPAVAAPVVQKPRVAAPANNRPIDPMDAILQRALA